MKLENQYCTAEQGKRLVELGIDKSAANFYHYSGFQTHQHGIVTADWVSTRNVNNSIQPAFSVAELLTICPESRHGVSYNHSGNWSYSATGWDRPMRGPLAHVLAHAIIYLLESRVESWRAECNERLRNG